MTWTAGGSKVYVSTCSWLYREMARPWRVRLTVRSFGSYKSTRSDGTDPVLLQRAEEEILGPLVRLIWPSLMKVQIYTRKDEGAPPETIRVSV